MVNSGLSDTYQLQDLELTDMHEPELILQPIPPSHIHRLGSIYLRHLGEVKHRVFIRVGCFPGSLPTGHSLRFLLLAAIGDRAGASPPVFVEGLD